MKLKRIWWAVLAFLLVLSNFILLIFNLNFFNTNAPLNGDVRTQNNSRKDQTNRPIIFFVETSLLSSYEFVNINARQACSIESAARAHPHLNILVMILSSLRPKFGENILLTQ